MCRDFEDQGGGGGGGGRWACAGRRLTPEQHPAEEAVVPVERVAVPAVLAELVLALRRPLGHAQANRTHHVWVAVAQLPLAAHQSWHVIAHHPGGASRSSHVPGKDQHRGENAVNREVWPRVVLEGRWVQSIFQLWIPCPCGGIRKQTLLHLSSVEQPSRQGGWSGRGHPKGGAMTVSWTWSFQMMLWPGW